MYTRMSGIARRAPLLVALDPGRPDGGFRHALVQEAAYGSLLRSRRRELHGRIGRALIEAVYAAADRAGAPHVYWLTRHDNATARTLYDRVARLSPFVKYDRPG